MTPVWTMPGNVATLGGMAERPNAIMPPLERCADRIEAQHRKLGHSLGWRFLTGPQRTFSAGTQLAFITPNPGGTRDVFG